MNAFATNLAASVLRTDLTNFKTANKGTVNSGTVGFNYAEGTHQTVEVSGNVQFGVANLPAIGGCLQINLTYTSGTIAFPGVTWNIGGGEQASTLADTGVQFRSGARYRIVLEAVNGVILGAVG